MSNQKNTRKYWSGTESIGKKSRENKCKKNRLGLSPLSFCWIIKKDLLWYSDIMIRHHNLKDGDFEKHSSFCQWFLHQYKNRIFLANFIIIGDEVGFTLNDAVNNHDEGMYTPAN